MRESHLPPSREELLRPGHSSGQGHRPGGVRCHHLGGESEVGRAAGRELCMRVSSLTSWGQIDAQGMSSRPGVAGLL